MFRSVGSSSHSGSSNSGTEPVKVQRSRTPQQIKAEKAARAAEEVSAAPVTQPLEPNKLPRFGVQENVYVLKEETMAGVKAMSMVMTMTWRKGPSSEPGAMMACTDIKGRFVKHEQYEQYDSMNF